MNARVKVNEDLFELAAGTDLDWLKRVFVAALRDAPAFVAFRTAGGAEVSVLIAPSTAVVLEENEDPPIDIAPVELLDWNDDSMTWGYE